MVARVSRVISHRTRWAVSTLYIRALFEASQGRDPLFAPVDGANCPNRVPAAATAGAPVGGLVGSPTPNDLRQAHSLLLDRGLFRIFLPVPKKTAGSNPQPTEYTIELISDPNGCNTDPAYNQEVDPITGEVTQIVSVYRRPLIAANLKFKTSTLANVPASGLPPVIFDTREPLPIDPFTGQFESLHIRWDGREPTLHSQASDATLIHSQAMTPPNRSRRSSRLRTVCSPRRKISGSPPLSLDATGGSRALSAVPA
jgi:cytochrome c peroxidase